jgi:hypothetical protein
MTVIDGFDDKSGPAGGKAVPQHEIDAQATREKMARLRALRLAQETANGTTAKPASSGKRTGAKKSAGKAAEKSVSLSDWLTTQQKEGRRN